MFQVLLPAEFREQHRRIVLEFTRRGHEFGRDEWRQAARIVHEGIELIVIDYETWKAKVRLRQTSDINEEGEKRDGPINY